eukprot:CAMPEP_0201582414 /NCGR_PEP_ID=MMETSP0190_2-20130828/84906_1 /ASSEMBLY_ACC=CAM_ASM_000263 /TAXON_ID=37353 /ORGANISM="Rosalina sp." /LENGTH=239 /DNA_ID=CAMNT_0048022271 /DNA_START=56 /DNA_END=775 /DNA_ORIENTATION=+
MGHPQLDWMKVDSRTCPYENDMEQRLAKFAELIYKISNDIPFGVNRDEFNIQLTDYLFYEQAEIFAVIFPDTIDESQSYFTYAAFQADQLDLSKHSSWYSMTALTHGSGINDPTPDEFYGDPSPLSLYDYLKQLSFGIKIVHGISYYYCDDDHSWGFNQANVYIKEKVNPWNNICKPKTYVGTAEIYPVFTKTINSFGNDEWLLEEWGIFWDIYAEKNAEFCAASADFNWSDDSDDDSR